MPDILMYDLLKMLKAMKDACPVECIPSILLADHDIVNFQWAWTVNGISFELRRVLADYNLTRLNFESMLDYVKRDIKEKIK